MTEGASSRPTVDEVYEHHRNQVNDALRRPGMYGGELALRLLLEQLAFVDGRTDRWRHEEEELRQRGAFNALGAPSVLSGGTNPRFPKTIAYATAERDAPLVSFHFWNDDRPDSTAGTPSPIYPEPVLLCVRHRPGSFHGSFTYTPEGMTRRPAD